MPSIENGTVSPTADRPYEALRPREYLTEKEVYLMSVAGKRGRYGHRDATMILLAYRHGLRAVEVYAHAL